MKLRIRCIQWTGPDGRPAAELVIQMIRFGDADDTPHVAYETSVAIDPNDLELWQTVAARCTEV